MSSVLQARFVVRSIRIPLCKKHSKGMSDKQRKEKARRKYIEHTEQLASLQSANTLTSCKMAKWHLLKDLLASSHYFQLYSSFLNLKVFSSFFICYHLTMSFLSDSINIMFILLTTMHCNR